MARKSFPVVLSAPSGTGKTTLAHLLVDVIENIHISVSSTTRERRGNERDGIDYNFVSEKEFDDHIKKGLFIEWANVHGHKYGSSSEWAANSLKEGKDIVFDIDVQGGMQLKKLFPNAVLIFIVPPSMQILEERLRQRGTDSEQRIKERMKAAREEIKLGLAHYDYVINNAMLDRALFDLNAIIRTHRLTGIDRKKIERRILDK